MNETNALNQNTANVEESPGNGISRRELLERLSPLGRITLDASKCTACGLCVSECPTGALSVEIPDETDEFSLIFAQGKCIACNQCVSICPEQCLDMERVLQAENIHNRVVLFEDSVVRCAQCGSSIGPKSMVTKLEARISAGGYTGPARSELCPACKIRAQFEQIKV